MDRDTALNKAGAAVTHAQEILEGSDSVTKLPGNHPVLAPAVGAWIQIGQLWVAIAESAR